MKKSCTRRELLSRKGRNNVASFVTNLDQIFRRDYVNIIKMKELTIGSLTSRIPIIQGGMGIGISLSGLASAVANQGGIGVISAAGIGMLEPDFHSNYIEANIRALRKEIQKAREKTKGILGVNIMVAMSNFADMVKTAIDEGIDIIFSGAGLPLNLPEFLNSSSKTKLVPIVSSGRAAKIISKRWFEKYDYVPDAIVVEGPMAGGHLGFKTEQINDPRYSLEYIVTDVMKELNYFKEKFKNTVPVIAAGGIYTGEDIYKIMQLGASGVQMATRFVTTDECDASVEFKNSYITAKKEDIVIIKSPVGMPGRAIINKFICDVRAGEKKPYICPYHCIITCDYKDSPYCIALALMNAKKGIMEKGFVFAGANAYRTNEIIPVQRLIESLEKEYVDAVIFQNTESSN
jgi:NAD(P)H-dependent flavin oxidoreductase YrpB (nitropropane dioxygenase family)